MEDRDMLIKVEQKLENAHDNQLQIVKDLRDIFKRLEYNSKVAVTLTIDLKGHIERSNLIWKNSEKYISEIEGKLKEIKGKIEVTDKNVIAERENRIKAITKEKDERVKEIQHRENFEKETKTVIRLITWVFTILGALATIVSAVTAIAVFIFK